MMNGETKLLKPKTVEMGRSTGTKQEINHNKNTCSTTKELDFCVKTSSTTNTRHTQKQTDDNFISKNSLGQSNFQSSHAEVTNCETN